MTSSHPVPLAACTDQPPARLRRAWLPAVALSALGLLAGAAHADDRNVMIVYDASGSMWGQIDGKAKIEIAREVLADLVKQWPASTHLGLVAYGHRQQTSCQDIETLVKPGPVDASRFLSRINQIKPLGRTPLTAAVQHAATELAYQDKPATVVLISDGVETCNADPCALSKQLAEKGVAFTAHVVGFDLKSGEHEKLSCIAENTGGLFVAAQNAQELQQALHQIQGQIVQPAPAPAPAAQPEITLTVPEAVQVGSTFELSWSDNLHPHHRLVVVAPGSNTPLTSRYTDKATSGTMRAPAVPGAYEVRYLAGSLARSIVAGRAPLEVLPAQQSITAPSEVQAGQTFQISWAQTLHQHNLIVIVPAGAQGSQGKTTDIRDQNKRDNRNIGAPPTPGDYEIRYMSGNTVMASAPLKVLPVEQSITAPAQAQTGEVIQISWTQTLHEHNLIVIVPAGAQGSQGKTTEERDRNKRSNREITAPTTPGDYEIRYMSGNSVMASTPLKVVQATQSLTAAGQALVNQNFQVAWGQALDYGDTVALVQPGATDAKQALSAVRAERRLQRNLKAPKEPGRFEIIYVAARSGQVLARKPIEIVASMTAEQAAAAPTTVGEVPTRAPAPATAPTPATPATAPAPAASPVPTVQPVVAAPAGSPSKSGLIIGLVSNAGYRYLDGAGCTYQPPGAKFDYDDQTTWQYAFIADIYGDKKRGWLRINDQVVELPQIHHGASNDLKVGQTYQSIYQANHTTVTLMHEVTQVDGASWETTGSMSINLAGRITKEAVQGECGS